MEVIPAVSFLDKEPVVVAKEEYEVYYHEDDEWGLNDVLENLADFDRMYYLDLNGIHNNKPQLDLIRKVSRRKEVWADMGARDIETITDAYIGGADRAVISTKTMHDLELLEEGTELSDKMIFSLDYEEGIVSPSEEIEDMSLDELVEEGLSAGIDMMVISNLSKDTFDLDLLPELSKIDCSVYIGGGIEKERHDLYSEHVDGIILGLEEAIRYLEMN